ncbi:Triphosphate tunnel metalloenzyme 3 [Linum perenne]
MAFFSRHAIAGSSPMKLPLFPTNLRLTRYAPVKNFCAAKVFDEMEVEVKLRLPDASSHQRLTAVLSPYRTKTLSQENIFFDTADSHLASNLAALRIRFYNLDSSCVLSLKAKPVIAEGISRVSEQEEPLDPQLGRLCVEEPWRLMGLQGRSNIMKRVREEYRVEEKEEKGLICLGGFRNVRQVFELKGLMLELDETMYDFGNSYELECETREPEKDKKLIEELLQENGIEFSYSTANKFAVFRSGKLPQ